MRRSQDRQVGGEEMIADAFASGAKQVSKSGFGEVVEEDAADAARLVAVLEVKIFVAPVLEARVIVVAERRSAFLQVGVEVHARPPRSRNKA